MLLFQILTTKMLTLQITLVTDVVWRCYSLYYSAKRKVKSILLRRLGLQTTSSSSVAPFSRQRVTKFVVCFCNDTGIHTDIHVDWQ